MITYNQSYNNIQTADLEFHKCLELLKINFSCDWEFLPPDRAKSHLNLIGNGALFQPLRHSKKIPGEPSINLLLLSINQYNLICPAEEQNPAF